MLRIKKNLLVSFLVSGWSLDGTTGYDDGVLLLMSS